MSSPSLSRSALSHFVARLSAVGLALVLITIVARQGGPQAQGAFSLLLASEAVFAALFSGFGLVLARRASHHRDEVSRWLGGGLLLALLAGLFGSGLFLAVAQWLGQEPAYGYLPWLALAAPLLLLAPTVSGLWLGLGRMGPLNLLTAAPPALALLFVAALALLPGEPGLLSVMLAWLAARALVGMAGAWHAARVHGLRPAQGRGPAASGWSDQARFCTVVGLTNLVSWLNYRVDLFIVERISGLAPAGIYAVAVTVAELLWFASSSVSTAAYARIGAPEPAQAARLTVRLVHLNLAVLLLASPLLVAAAWWLLPRLLGPAYADSLPLLLWLLPGVWAYASASTLSAYYTNQLGRPQLAAAVAATSLAINVGLCLVLVPRWGATGAAAATSASYLLAIVWGLALFRRHAGLRWAELLRPQWAGLRQDLAAPLRLLRP